ncbi:MAG: exonuclease domain-containing protein [Acidimicrobiales bacterium]
MSAVSAVAFDLETTGVDPFFDVPVSFAFAWREGPGPAAAETGLVDPGRSIPAGATRVHGITDAMVAGAPDLASAVPALADRLEAIWREGGVVVGMNVAYDLTMIDSLLGRLGRARLADRGVGAVADVLVLDRHLDRYRRGKRTLTDLCVHYGVALEGAHSAAVDAAASLDLYERLLERYPEIAATPIERLTELQAGWHREWISSFSRYLERRGGAPVDPGRYEWPLHAAP